MTDIYIYDFTRAGVTQRSLRHLQSYWSKMLRNKGVVYLSFHLSKSDVKAHDILYSESLVFCMDNVQKCVFVELLFCVRRLG